jgi:hypothetical protein
VDAVLPPKKRSLTRLVLLVGGAALLLLVVYLGVENWVVSQRMSAALQLKEGMSRAEVEEKLGTDQTKEPWLDDSGNESRQYRVDFRGLTAVRSQLVEVRFGPDGRLVKWSSPD